MNAFPDVIDPSDQIDLQINYQQTCSRLGTSLVSAAATADAEAIADGVTLGSPLVSGNAIRIRLQTANDPQDDRSYEAGYTYKVRVGATMADGQILHDTYEVTIKTR